MGSSCNGAGGLFLLLGLLVFGAAQLLLFPVKSIAIAESVFTGAMVNFLLGFALMIASPFGIGLLAATIVGIPLTVVLALAYVSLAISGFVTFGLAIGLWLFKRADWPAAKSIWTKLGALTLGMLLLILSVIPLLGIVAVAASLMGVGAMAIQLYRTWKGAEV